MSTYVELCAGTASVALAVLAGRPVQPPTGYMGSKRRWAGWLARHLVGGRAPDRVLLVDGGPWGDAWSTLRDAHQRRAVSTIMRGWERDWFCGPDGASRLWRWLVELPPYADPPMRCAQYLWLQARSAGTIPIWWSPENQRWESPSGARIATTSVDAAGRMQGGGDSAATRRQKGTFVPPSQIDASRQPLLVQGVSPRFAAGYRGIWWPTTIAQRLDALDRLPWDRVEVVHGRVEDIEPIPGATVYYDPPYQHAPRYALMHPRADVLAVAQRWADVGCRVAVSEAEALPLPGWHARRLPGARRPEWVTSTWEIRDEQLRLLA